MLRAFASPEDAPLLYVSTYEAGEVLGCDFFQPVGIQGPGRVVDRPRL